MDRAILKKWLEAGVIERESFSLTTTGTPQGGIISPVLMNLTLDGLESLLAKHFPPRRGNLVKLVRFADDFVITGRTKELLEEEVKPLTVEFLRPRGLKLSESKTRITHIKEGFDFLGKRFQKHDCKLLSKPSRRLLSVSRRDGLLSSVYPPERIIHYFWRRYYDRSNSVRSA